MSKDVREQRISLRVHDVSLSLKVPATEEAYYRRGAEELNLTLDLYRQRYAGASDISPMKFLVMASVDVAYHSMRWQAAASRVELGQRLEALAHKAEECWLEHKYALEHLEQGDTATEP